MLSKGDLWYANNISKLLYKMSVLFLFCFSIMLDLKCEFLELFHVP